MLLLNDIEGLSERELKDRIANAYECDPKEVNKFEIILGMERYESYEGSSYYLLYNREDDKFYEVSGGHCSCNGMEGQWSPSEVTDLANLNIYCVDDEDLTRALTEWKHFNGYSGH